MSKTALLEAVKAFDVERVRDILTAKPELKDYRDERGFNLLQLCCKRSTVDDPEAADRQLKLAKWFVAHGFDPLVIYTTAAGEDGEPDPAELSLVFFAVARAQNTALARFFLKQGAKPQALFAAAWWGNADILADLVKHGADVNEFVGATPLHMAVDVFSRGTEGQPERARHRMKTLKEFLRLGADPNIPAFDKRTPLHTVLEKGYEVEVFKLLLKHGANPDMPGKDNRTVREIAARKRDKRYIEAIEAITG